MALSTLVASGVSAQAVPRNYDRGPVTMIQEVEVKPGQLNAYMQDLQKGWRVSMEEGKRAGAILGCSIQRPVDPRAGEPDLYLITVFKDLASVDRPLADSEKSAVAQYGSLDLAREAAMKRNAWRTNKGSMLLESLEFMK